MFSLPRVGPERQDQAQTVSLRRSHYAAALVSYLLADLGLDRKGLGNLQTLRQTRFDSKSGGPVMTVVKIANGQCLCKFDKPKLESQWFTPTAVESLWFSEAELEVAEPEGSESA